VSWSLTRVPPHRRAPGPRPFFLVERHVGFDDYGAVPLRTSWFVGWLKLSHSMGEKTDA
jgi:hypothetical protein